MIKKAKEIFLDKILMVIYIYLYITLLYYKMFICYRDKKIEVCLSKLLNVMRKYMDASEQKEGWLLMKGIMLEHPKMLFCIIVIFLK